MHVKQYYIVIYAENKYFISKNNNIHPYMHYINVEKISHNHLKENQQIQEDTQHPENDYPRPFRVRQTHEFQSFLPGQLLFVAHT